MGKISQYIEKHFLLLALLFSGWALLSPELFVPIKPCIPILLGLIMFGMGLTLTFASFKDVWQHRSLVCLGVFMQYLIMPLLALFIGKALPVSKEVMIGLVLVGACPGGTASNVICYLAKGNVPLSITMTLVSTCLAPLMTPWIIWLILSQKIDVSFFSMMKSVFWIVAFPLCDGLIIRQILKNKVEKYTGIFPSISIISICLILGCVVALNHNALVSFPTLIFFAVMLHNTGGLCLGYGIPKLLGYAPEECKTFSIEIGMQNSGLGVVLALKFFTAASALVGVLFSVWHNISGIILAKWWANRHVS